MTEGIHWREHRRYTEEDATVPPGTERTRYRETVRSTSRAIWDHPLAMRLRLNPEDIVIGALVGGVGRAAFRAGLTGLGVANPFIAIAAGAGAGALVEVAREMRRHEHLSRNRIIASAIKGGLGGFIGFEAVELGAAMAEGLSHTGLGGAIGTTLDRFDSWLHHTPIGWLKDRIAGEPKPIPPVAQIPQPGQPAEVLTTPVKFGTPDRLIAPIPTEPQLSKLHPTLDAIRIHDMHTQMVDDAARAGKTLVALPTLDAVQNVSSLKGMGAWHVSDFIAKEKFGIDPGSLDYFSPQELSGLTGNAARLNGLIPAQVFEDYVKTDTRFEPMLKTWMDDMRSINKPELFVQPAGNTQLAGDYMILHDNVNRDDFRVVTGNKTAYFNEVITKLRLPRIDPLPSIMRTYDGLRFSFFSQPESWNFDGLTESAKKALLAKMEWWKMPRLYA